MREKYPMQASGVIQTACEMSLAGNRRSGRCVVTGRKERFGDPAVGVLWELPWTFIGLDLEGDVACWGEAVIGE